jgi:hypothetical protein
MVSNKLGISGYLYVIARRLIIFISLLHVGTKEYKKEAKRPIIKDLYMQMRQGLFVLCCSIHARQTKAFPIKAIS